mgnify:CR=1 FL=1
MVRAANEDEIRALKEKLNDVTREGMSHQSKVTDLLDVQKLYEELKERHAALVERASRHSAAQPSHRRAARRRQ